jgi:hypothetical protein
MRDFVAIHHRSDFPFDDKSGAVLAVINGVAVKGPITSSAE